MKAFLALTFLAALSLAVSSFWLIRFSFKYHKGLQKYFFNPSFKIAIVFVLKI
jgi:hypothetical protein